MPKPQLPADAVYLSEVLENDWWAGNFTKKVGDVVFPTKIYRVSPEGESLGVFSFPSSSVVSSTNNEIIAEKLNLISPTTRRVWVVGRMLNGGTGGAVQISEWLATTGLSPHKFHQGLAVLSELYIAHPRWEDLVRGRANVFYNVRGPPVSPLELVSLE